jgi:hypothetical protein
MNSERLKQVILENGAEITRLRTRTDETLGRRSSSPQGRDEWKTACAQFHERYSELALPGGYDGAAARILAGNPTAMEAAVCFLECRPYFFRSGYMYKRAAAQGQASAALARAVGAIASRYPAGSRMAHRQD